MSPQAEGANAQIIYDEESTYKTDPGTPDCKVLPFVTSGLKLDRNLFSSKAITNSRNPKKPGRGKYNIGGPIALEINPYIGTILKHLLGSNADTGADPYMHTMKVGVLPVGLVMEVGFTDISQYFKYNGCRINKFDLSVNSEGIIEGSIEVMGAKETVGSSSLDATPVDLGHKPFDAFEASLEEGGSAIATVSEVKLSFEQNLDGSVYVIGGGGERVSLPAGTVKISGSLKAMFEDLTLYNKAINHTETSLKTMFSRGDGLGSAGNESLEFLIPEMVYKPKSPEVAGPQGVYVDLEFEGYYDNSTEATTLQAILKNTQATV
ncbi:MAG TPA: hypothetical protein ENH31_00330 [Nitrospirae bacterium]|nr:hypothetical protein [Nitrospirota bacterium]HDK17146.1 hypothetical protein [Nitrospirota bacterium]HDK80998.1 hypothetical protein [Nitrospirota bacterium]